MKKESLKLKQLELPEVAAWATATQYQAVQAAWVKEQESQGVQAAGRVMEKVGTLMNEAMK